MSKRLFETAKHVDLYAKFRPHYGKDIYDRIFRFCRETGNTFNVAVDVGCGNGQSTRPLAGRFKQVLGLDISPKQIELAAADLPNLKYGVGGAEVLSAVVASNSVDLVTIAQAIHWIDKDKFDQELDVILRLGGAVVAYGYGNCTVDNPSAEEVLSKFYWGTLKGYWDEKRDLINNHYRDINFNRFSGYIRDDTLKIRKDWSVEQLIGYVSSWSGWQSYLKAHPNSTGLEDVKQSFTAIYKTKSNEEPIVHVEWPVFMLFGQKTA